LPLSSRRSRLCSLRSGTPFIPIGNKAKKKQRRPSSEKGGIVTHSRDPFATRRFPAPEWTERPRRHGQAAYPFGGRLSTVIETEIIPRLLIAHRDRGASEAAGSTPVALAETVDSAAFAEFALGSETGEIVDRLRRLVEQGIELPRIYLDLIAPCARRMRELWENDLCSFADVTLGLTRLEHALRAVGGLDDQD
jgi:hypothetical protein